MGIVEDAIKKEKYCYNKWSLNNFKYWHSINDLLPLKHTGILFNHSFNIPNNTKKWLLDEYDTLDKPIERSYDYEDKYYWMTQMMMNDQEYDPYQYALPL